MIRTLPARGLSRDLDFFSDAFALLDAALARPAVATPPPTEGPWTLELDLPGLSAEDVELTWLDGALRVRAERRLTVPDGATPLRRERRGWTVDRLLRLPADADPESIEAAVQDGVLSVRVARVARPEPRRIEVRGRTDAAAPAVVEVPEAAAAEPVAAEETPEAPAAPVDAVATPAAVEATDAAT